MNLYTGGKKGVDDLIEKYHITDETEVGLLRSPVINLMDGAEELFNQG